MPQLNRRPVPWLTITVFAVTALVTASQFVWPEVLLTLRRDPAMLSQHQYWRFVTTWLVHDGGWPQIAFNFPVLAVLGTLTEWRFGRWRWLVAYVTCGLVGEITGLFWQPIGGGNSVAMCGLAGLMALRQLLRPDVPVPARLGFPVIVAGAGLWLAAKGDIHGPSLLAGLVLAAIMFAFDRRPFTEASGG